MDKYIVEIDYDVVVELILGVSFFEMIDMVMELLLIDMKFVESEIEDELLF